MTSVLIATFYLYPKSSFLLFKFHLKTPEFVPPTGILNIGKVLKQTIGYPNLVFILEDPGIRSSGESRAYYYSLLIPL